MSEAISAFFQGDGLWIVGPILYVVIVGPILCVVVILIVGKRREDKDATHHMLNRPSSQT